MTETPAPVATNPLGAPAPPPSVQFDVTAPIPHGTTLIEASAGTGKTWTLSALVTRLVAEEGLPLEELLVVTFSRAASQELRERVREQLERVLTRLRQAPRDDDGVLVAALRSDDPGVLAERCDRLARALASFDSALIATIHQFCHDVLKGLGVAGDSDSFATLVEDTTGLRDEVIDDLYVARRAQDPSFDLSHERARFIGHCVLTNTGAALDAPADDSQRAVIDFAEALRNEYARRKRRAGILEYDDLLVDLRTALRATPSIARERMRARWSVVLVDEFQDTDPVQWEVFQTAFSEAGRSLILVGDPKQAIYGFRGGDVHTYLRASQTAEHRSTLPTNYRSDGPLVDALGRLMGNVTLSPGIVAHPVTADRETSRLVGDAAPIEMRWVNGDPLPAAGARSAVAHDLAVRASELLASGTTFGDAPLAPHHMAVLARTHAQLLQVREQLRAAGIPAVMMSGDSVLRSSAGAWWLELLLALEQPHRAQRVRAACLTPLIGWDVARIDALETADVDESAELVHALAAQFEEGGIPAVMDALRARGMLERLLARVGGERDVTDIEHCAQLLTERQLATGGGIAALVAWVQEQSAADAKVTADARLMRLDSDAQAVTLSTIHASKGLQYPIVFAPTLWNRWDKDRSVPDIVYTEAGRVVSFDPGVINASRSHEEASGEEMRLAYVAMTRAQSKVVLWWAPTARSTSKSALHRLLFGQAADAASLGELLTRRTSDKGSEVITTTEQNGLPRGDKRFEILQTWAEHRAFTLTEVVPGAKPTPVHVAVSSDEMNLSRFDPRLVDTSWRRTSYSALSAAGERADELAGVVSEPDAVGAQLDPDVDLALPQAPSAPDVPGADALSPMHDQPLGATFGSLVHGVLEEADFQADDLDAELHRHIVEQQLRWPTDVDVDALVEALRGVLATPFGPLADDVCLRRIATSDRIAEMDFEIPLGGGDTPHARATLRAFADVLRRHLPEDDPLRPYADHLEASLLGEETLRGYLTGSIDLTFRHGGRYFVVDYKTNRLGDPDAPLTLSAYGPEALAAAMNHSSYPLQAILYAVVLHRYLRWRLPGYDPETHLGGVMYLYVRGMAGADTPRGDDDTPFGVFTWRPPAALVVALSAIIDGRERGSQR